jgi:MSHA pilin protein MshC
MVELVMVIVLLGVVAAIGIPKLMGTDSTGTLVFGEQVVSALRNAHKSAVAKRRIVCATLQGGSVTLRIRENPGLPAAGETACLLNAGVTDTEYGSTNGSVTAGAGAFASSASIALFFHPDGTVTRDAAGTQPVAPADAILIKDAEGTQRTILIEGTTGHVR